jgi:hypothetical protein
MGATNTKLTYSKVAPPFATASELRDALLRSYPEASYFGGAPVVSIHRGDETEAAWLWIARFMRQRTDWWPAIGIALQHAVQDGGDIARVALADLLGISSDSIMLLPWTRPLAVKWPDVKAVSPNAHFGAPDLSLAKIIAAQHEYWEMQRDAVVSVGLEPGGRYISVDVQTQEQLDDLLAKSARVGQRDSFGAQPTDGPWTWLVPELVLHERLRPMVVAACTKFSDGTNAEVRAVLDWFTDEHDLWRYVDLLETWERAHPTWWNAPADTKPQGWKYPIRAWLADQPKTLGDIAVAALTRARAQAATPPILDLPPIDGHESRRTT